MSDEKFIRRCIELAERSLESGENPFSALVVRDGKIISESTNKATQKIFLHAEIVAMNEAKEKLGDLSDCVLYSNCEPCPMCAFMAREFKVGKVVYALSSPFMGGHTRWNILEDDEITQFEPYFAKPPKVVKNVLEKDARKAFDKAGLWMFGSHLIKKARRRR
ncbi:hypothetical protein A3K63_02960 [Candidatus Micrarchaeota archaeon RBG_16_49_10]|nr:MAG: hypothetical protein A3K63_02960 [Candidatus Micrarchaeota archaeon RBG_16_49_10]